MLIGKRMHRRFIMLLMSGCFLYLGFQLSCGTPTPSEPTDAGHSDTTASHDKQPQESKPTEPRPTEPRPPEPTQETPPESKPPLDLSERLPAGTARAGIIRTKEEFIGGLNAKESIGDIKLYNSKVAFTVAGVRIAHGYLSFGGKLVAADIIRPKGQSGQSLFQEFSLAFQHRMMKPDKVEIVNDGSDGKAAVVRFYGKDQGLDLLLSYIKAFAASLAQEADPLDFSIVNEYRLEPDSEVLEIRTTLTNAGPRYKDISFSEVGFFMGDGLTNYFPDKGELNGKDALGYWPYHGFASPQVGYVVFPKPGEMFQSLVKYKTVMVGLQAAFTLDANSSKTLVWHVAVGRDLAAAQAAYRRKQPNHTSGTITGRLLDPDTQKPLAGLPIYIEQARDDNKIAYVGQAISQADGTYTVELPPGEYTLRAARHQIWGKAEQVTLKADEKKTLDLTTPSAGTLEVAITETRNDGTAPLPAKVSVKLLDTPGAGIPSTYGRASYAGGAAVLEYPHTGKATISLAPGRYRITVTRGFFYSQHEEEVTVKVGEKVTVNATLKRLIETTDSVSGDFHVHAHGSPDSQDSNQLKVAAMTAEGLELAVSTDHEFVTDYQPVINEMGLKSWIRAIVGEEVTTHFGHFNTYPIPFRPEKVNNGAFQWYKLLAPGMFDLVLSESPDSIIQINHPRGLPAGAYFSYAGYNPETGKPELKPKEWSWKFHAIEVVNGNDFSKALTTTLPDWYSMLNRGYRITAMGNSDSHGTHTSEVGYPRNIIRVGSNDPQKLTISGLSEAIKKQRVVVSGGAMIRFTASAGNSAKLAQLGDLLTLDETGKAILHIRVEATPAIHLNKLQVLENGKVIAEKTLPDDKSKLIRFDDIVEVTPSKDSWYIVMVTGTQSLGAVAPGKKPFAFTNPIFVDVNKDQKFDPPVAITP